MSADWIKENISLPHQNFMYMWMIKKINESAEKFKDTAETADKKKVGLFQKKK